jgi:hypothetical protein
MSLTKATSNVIAPITATGSTTARTLENRFADVVNVKDFGAVGNGVADDTAAIQAAINSVATTGGDIFLPSGNYKTTSELLVANGDTCISGENVLSTRITRHAPRNQRSLAGNPILA